MSTRYNNGSHYENHQRAAELHNLAAHAHRVAGQHGQQDHQSGHEHSRQALEYSTRAHQHTQEALAAHGLVPFGHHEIATLAHELWQARGRPEGSPEVDWFAAVEQLRSRNLDR
jgi:hypothetical protein